MLFRSPAKPAVVDIVRHEDTRVTIRVQTEADGYLRLADAWDAGWRAEVDGKDAKIHVADHYLRAVYLTPGEHEVVFTMDAPRVIWPPRISFVALLAILWLLLRRRPGTVQA